MKIKTLLRYALLAMLPAAAVTAFAVDEVTLSDGTPMSWADFVEKLKNPPTVTDAKGQISDLPASNQAKASYDAAQKKVDADEIDLQNKKAAVKYDPKAETHPQLVADSLSALGNLNTAQKNLENYTAVADAQKEYEDAEEQLATWNTQLEQYNKDVTKYTGQVTSYGSQLTKAEKTRDAAQKAYDAVGTTTEVTNYVDWLTPINTAAQNYLTTWQEYFSSYVPKDATIYYKIDSGIMPPNRSAYNLVVAFVRPAVYDETKGWKTSTNTEDFCMALYPTDINGGNGYIFSTIKVYLGENLKDLNEKSVGGVITFQSTPSSNDYIIQYAVSEITNLSKQPGYFTTTLNTIYNDPEGKLKKALDDAIDEVDRIEGLKETADENLATANENVITTESSIEGYTVTKGADGKTEQERLKAAWDNALEDENYTKLTAAVTEAEEGVEKANKAIAAGRSAVTVAEAKLADDQEALANAEAVAQAAANEIANAAATEAARAVYKNISLTGDVTVTEVIPGDYSGIIAGGNNCITLSGVNSVFSGSFSGTLTNVAVNYPAGGKFATSISKGTFEEVATWNGTSGRFYDESGNATPYEELGKLGYEARTLFGVNFKKNELASLNDATKVYSITVYNTDSNVHQFVNLDGTSFIGADGDEFVIPTNMFASSATSDVKNKCLINVYYIENNNYICDNVVISDKDKVEFFAPVDIVAKNLTYDREFAAGMNAVVLPFDLFTNENVRYLGEYDGETTDKFWFKYLTEKLPANTPGLVYAKNDFTLPTLTNVTVKKTTDQIVPGIPVADGSTSYGVYKRVNPTEIVPSQGAHKIWGIGGNKFVSVGKTAMLNPFRMVIYSMFENSDLPSEGGNPAPRRIAFRDEMGLEIGDFTTGIEDVAAVESSLDITTGHGQIIFTSEADFGKVAVYNLDGAVITVVDVIAGTTTANVEKGIYIVNGKKVMVK